MLIPCTRETERQELEDVLIEYLTNIVPQYWPGGDGFTKSEVLRQYPAAAMRRHVPNKNTLLRLHPHLNTEIRSFFASQVDRPDTSHPAKLGEMP